MTPIEKWDIRSYPEELAANIRAQRARAALSQQALAARMRRLGFSSWLFQTVGRVEHADRPVTAAEILGLSLAMECTVQDLMVATPLNHLVGYPGYRKGHGFHGLDAEHPAEVDVIGARTVTEIAQGVWDRALSWDGDDIVALSEPGAEVAEVRTARPRSSPRVA